MPDLIRHPEIYTPEKPLDSATLHYVPGYVIPDSIRDRNDEKAEGPVF